MSISIDRKTYNIIAGSNFPDLRKFNLDEDTIMEKLCFDVDEEIAPIVALLNKKGYYTRFSCAGHFVTADYLVKPSCPKGAETIASLRDPLDMKKGHHDQLVIKELDNIEFDGLPYIVIRPGIELKWKDGKNPFDDAGDMCWELKLKDTYTYTKADGSKGICYAPIAIVENIDNPIKSAEFQLNIFRFYKHYGIVKNSDLDSYYGLRKALLNENEWLYNTLRDNLLSRKIK